MKRKELLKKQVAECLAAMSKKRRKWSCHGCLADYYCPKAGGPGAERDAQ